MHAVFSSQVDCCQLSTVPFLHLSLTIAWVITTSRWARKLDHSKKEGRGKSCFRDAELACRLALQGRKQLFLGANAAVTRCLRRVFLRSSSIKLGFRDVSDSISLSQAVLSIATKMVSAPPVRGILQGGQLSSTILMYTEKRGRGTILVAIESIEVSSKPAFHMFHGSTIAIWGYRLYFLFCFLKFLEKDFILHSHDWKSLGHVGRVSQKFKRFFFFFFFFARKWHLTELLPSPSHNSGHTFRKELYPVPLVKKSSSLSSFFATLDYSLE